MKLKNCPFCDGKAYHEALGITKFAPIEAKTYRIVCLNCECQTPERVKMIDAEKIWNTRIQYYSTKDDKELINIQYNEIAKLRKELRK